MARKRALAPCGTNAAARRHRKLREPLCDPCRKAWADYIRVYRIRKPEIAAKGKAQVAALSRAKTRLAAEFPDRLAELYAAELTEVAR